MKMILRERRPFHARWSKRRGWWNLYCRKCGTTEELTRGESFPEEIAAHHVGWFHLTPPRVPVGWASPSGSGRACDHLQCPPFECRGC